MRKGFRKRFIAQVVIIALMLTCTLSTVSAFAGEPEPVKNNMSVNGSYSIKVNPDVAYIEMGIKTFDAKPAIAKEDNRTKMNGVKGQLKSLGIEDKNIQTVDYRIIPKYETKEITKQDVLGNIKNTESILIGYDVVNRIKLTVYDLTRVGDIIDLTVQEGINDANNVTFGLTEKTRTERYLEVLKGAVENAKAKAEVMASVYQIKLTVPKFINEGSVNYQPMMYNSYNKGGSEMYDGEVAQSTPIYSGLMNIQANVSLMYEY
ncbi:MAG: SIMPL domain-containing protein [Hyphomonadaceae bacterium]|nr:SIMPL domain-containing protein [Clostridia bacterium]